MIVLYSITGCLAGLDPSLDFCLEAGGKLQPSLLPYLANLIQKTNDFLADLEPFLTSCTEKECRKDVTTFVLIIFKSATVA